jgi:hypothetical protein
MPFTFDAQSWLEQRLVVTMAAPDPRHVARSAHRQVAALMIETSGADWIE